MTYQITFFLLVIVSVFAMVLTKAVVNRLHRNLIGVGVFYLYLFCAILTIIYFLFSGGSLTFPVLLAGAVGAMVGFACYFEWRAFETSLSKSMLFFPLIQGIPIILAVIFLGESKLWNFQLSLGMALCFLAAWLFRTKETIKKKWFFYLMAMVVILGIAEFLVKLFSFNMPRETFLLGWYNGALLTCLGIVILGKQQSFKIPGKTILLIIPVSFSLLGALFLLYWTYQLGGDVSWVVPSRWLLVTLTSILLGWFIFKERKGLSKREWLGFLVGIIAAILILTRLR